MRGAGTLLDLLPGAAGSGIVGEVCLAATKFVAFCGGNFRCRVLCREAVPQVCDQLQPLCATEFEYWREFGGHGYKLAIRSEGARVEEVIPNAGCPRSPAECAA